MISLQNWLKHRLRYITWLGTSVIVVSFFTYSLFLISSYRNALDRTIVGSLDPHIYELVTTRNDLDFRNNIEQIINGTPIKQLEVKISGEVIKVPPEYSSDCEWITCGMRLISLNREILNETVFVSVHIDDSNTRSLILIATGLLFLAMGFVFFITSRLASNIFENIRANLKMLLAEAEGSREFEKTVSIEFQEFDFVVGRLSSFQEELRLKSTEVSRNAVLSEVGKRVLQFSHDVKSPLSVLDMLKNSFDDEQRRLLYSEALARIDKITSGLLNDYKKQRVKSFNLSDIFQRLEREKRAVLSHDISIKWSNNVNEEVLLPDIDMESMLSNLINNSVQAMDVGRILVSSTKVNDELSISVCDTGPGIPEAVLTKIAKGEIVTTKTGNNEAGYGLGLNSIAQILKNVGAKLEIKNEKQGARVTLRFKVG